MHVGTYASIHDVHVQATIIPVARKTKLRIINMLTAPVDRRESRKNGGDGGERPACEPRTEHPVHCGIRAQEKHLLRATLVEQELERNERPKRMGDQVVRFDTRVF